MEYWADYPPTHLLVRAYMGVGSENAKPKRLDCCNDWELDEFLMAVNGGQ
ncbi:MAG: hypothetical protein FWG12_06300 [Holophagaceae bacterium]|nr:hypothetical protein [Holophagaceae bacterium]